MKIRFNRLFALICAVIMICTAFAWADEATPTDLSPEAEPVLESAERASAAEQEEVPAEEPEEEPAEEPTEEPEEEPAEEPEEDPAEEPSEEPAEEPVDDSAEEPAEEPTEESAEEPAAEPEAEPVEEPAEEPAVEPAEESTEEPLASMEVIITKALRLGESWDGKVGKTKPALLKLDLKQPGTVYMLVEGKDIWATVEKSDRQTENSPRTQTDPETNRTIIRWEAEAGSYLITLGPVEPNLLGVVTVTFMDSKTYEAWEAAQAETEPEPENEPEKEPVEEPKEEPVEELEKENRPESETADEPVEELENEPVEEEYILPENRNAEITITWDDDHPAYGSVAHFDAKLIGYENLDYTLQWQWSRDDEIWTDVAEATDTKMDVVYTQENGSYYWRLIVYIIQPTEI